MLSARGRAWSKISYMHGEENLYHPVHNPNGVVTLNMAENWFMKEDMTNYINTHVRTPLSVVCISDDETLIQSNFSVQCCTYGEGYTEWVDVGHTDQFTPDCVELYEKGFEEAKARGSNVKALLICNPHNPLGLLKLCAAKGIHLISDEIYALTVYNRDNRPSEKFTSIRAIDYTGIIDPRQVHILYGMAKDYAAAGLRLGCIISQNTEFSNAIRAGCRFSSPSQLSMEIAAKLLEDQDHMKQFLAKSHREILKSRLLTEQLLSDANVSYSDKGNAAFFLWIDLTSYLPLEETGGDGWAAEKLLSERFTKAGVLMDTGAEYHTPVPGRFRLMHTVDEVTLREGFRRLVLPSSPFSPLYRRVLIL
ncbi:1-aminocyclopropane-1-carboxylate synthase 1 protein [Rutstroemia sp. NJR-2017a BBW]|nr:1-aminocyclopropane-1-carboxylate synthase 1 protein [Rutstroemia sp. NJR-2017a BBW]